MTAPTLPQIDEQSKRIQATYADYLGRDSEEMPLMEWVNGEIIVHMPPGNEHQILLGFLYRLISEYVALFEVGVVQIAPFEVKLWPDGPSREPDLFFLKKEQLRRLDSRRLYGVPDLVVELISPDSVSRDRKQKFGEYEQAGVFEYWLIDSRPGFKQADFFRLDENGVYQLVATQADSFVESPLFSGFRLDPTWLWQWPHPDVLTLLYHMSSQVSEVIRSRLNLL